MKEKRQAEKMEKQTKLIEEENIGYFDIETLLDDIYDKFEKLAEEATHAEKERKKGIDEIMSHFYWDILDAAKTIGEED